MNSAHNAVLFSLLDLAKNDQHATVLRVADAAGLDRAEVVSSLAALDKVGLVDSDRVRLTMMGLVVASGLKAPRARREIAKKAA
jgi:predicted transcriptional regulator